MKGLMSVCGVLLTMSAMSAEVYYKGDLPGGITNCQNYTSTSQLKESDRLDHLPGADDQIVIVSNDQTIDIDDGNIAFLKTIDGVNTKKSKNFTLHVHIEHDQDFGCWCGDISGYGSLYNAKIVKTGAGALTFARVLDSTHNGANRIGLDIREGDVHCENPWKQECTDARGHVKIAEGCTLYVITNGNLTVQSLSGAGTVTHDAQARLRTSFSIVLSDDQAVEPTVFSGKISGDFYVVNLTGNTCFTGNQSDMGGALRGYGWEKGYINGFASYPESGISSLGSGSSIDNRNGPICLRYLGDGEQSGGRKLTVWNTTARPTTIDGGLNGGFTWKGLFDPADGVLKQQRVCLSGSNLVRKCVLDNAFTHRSINGTNFSFYVTKDGPGTWLFKHNDKRDWTGGLAVEDGTLEFETIAEAGRLCSLGFATELYEDVCGYTSDMTPVPYAWKLGCATNAARVGTLEYVGDRDRLLESRSTVLAGSGSFRFGAGSRFKYAAGISGLGTGDKEIRFACAAGATNVVSGVGDGSTGAKVSVVKEGAGACTLTGDLGFTGDIRVEDGELTLKDLNNAPYTWYRINFKENVSTSTNPAFDAYHSANPTKRAGIKVTAFGLYDENGKYLLSGETNATWLALAPGEGQVADIEDLTFEYNSKYSKVYGVNRLFGNDCGAGMIFHPDWNDSTRYPIPSDPSTWFRVYVRLKEGSKTPRFWDMAYYSTTSTGHYAYNVTALSVDASADGATWQEVAATNSICFFPTNTYAWISNDIGDGFEQGKYSGNRTESCPHPNKFPLSATAHQGTYARPAPRSVGVAPGAKLVVEGTPVEAMGVTLGTGGFGEVSGVTLAEDGTIDLVCDLSGKPARVDFPVAFSKFGDTGVRALGYDVTVNGGAVPASYDVSVAADGVTLVRKGLLLIVR